MADEIANSTPAPAASTAASSAEAAASTETPAVQPASPDTTPVVEPVVEPVKTDAPVETPKTDTPAEAPKTEEAKKAETLLGQEKKAEEKPVEVKPETKPEEKVAETKEAEIPQLPSYEPFTLPENIKFDEGKMDEFTKFLGEFESTNKLPHDAAQKLGQEMVDRHLAELNRYTESLTTAWEKQKTDWKDSFAKDPEFSNRHDTVVNAAIDAIGIYGGNDAQQNEFRELMESTGIGNHPAMIRLLSNITLAKAEPKPLAAPTIAPKGGNSKIERMYGKKSA